MHVWTPLPFHTGIFTTHATGVVAAKVESLEEKYSALFHSREFMPVGEAKSTTAFLIQSLSTAVHDGNAIFVRGRFL